MNNTRTEKLTLNLIKIFKIYLCFLFIFTIFRCVFVGYFGEIDHLTAYRDDLLKSFYMGWKYDTLVLSYMLSPIYLLFSFTALVNWKLLSWISKNLSFIFFVIMGIVLPFILICDLGFYSFFQDHINILFFGFIEDDTIALLESLWKNYPILEALIGFGIYLVGFSWVISKCLKNKKLFFNLKSNFFVFNLIFFTGLILLVGGARGGYGKLVLAPKYADFSESEFINQAALNGVIALEKTIQLRKSKNSKDFNMLKEMGYSSGIHSAYSDFLGFDVSVTREDQLINLIKRRTPNNPDLKNEPLNVVVIVMESFGGNWVQYNEPEFNFMQGLEKHFSEDFYFKRFISSENGTIGSMMSLITNIPPRPGKRYLSESKFLKLPLETSSHKVYQSIGYETFFVYGGKLGWRDIGKYVRVQGYDNIIGENAIKKSLSLKGDQGTEWGLYDEHFFNYILAQLESSHRPKFFLGLSTSNHPPFETPESFGDLSLKIPRNLETRISREKNLFIERFKAFAYANKSLSNFLNKIKNSSLSQNTVVAVTGDHNFWGFMNYKKEEMFQKYLVPFYLYFPKSDKLKKNFKPDKLGSHEDIMPTLYNLTLSNQEYLSFGEDLFSENKSVAINGSIIASEEAVRYKNKYHVWLDRFKVDAKKVNLEIPFLEKRYRSTMAITDDYLEKSLKTFQSKK